MGLHASEAVSDAPGLAGRPPSIAAATAQLVGGNLLDEMIAQTESKIAGAESKREPDAVREFAQRVAAQYEVSTPDPQQPKTVAVLDAAVGGLMRAILHNPDFQAMEAAWRATHLLVRELETGSQTQALPGRHLKGRTRQRSQFWKTRVTRESIVCWWRRQRSRRRSLGGDRRKLSVQSG